MPFSGRRVSESLADLNLLKGWIKICERDHNDYEEISRYDSPTLWKAQGYTLRVIDIEENCIVIAGWDTRYVALSYVWGGVDQLRAVIANERELATEGALLQEKYRELLPQTIKDAMCLAAKMGERYLWVDSLCIIQDGPDIGNDVQNMDSIYGGATWCLVAASANGANDHLPRIGCLNLPCENAQQAAIVQERELAVILPTLTAAFHSSRWNTRAWTYQERVLSKRLLIVSEKQIYFNCFHDYTFCEDIEFESSTTKSHGANSEERAGQIYGVDGLTNFEVYARAVEAYSARNITYHEDALKAFAGIMAHLETSFRGLFLFGLPDKELDQALLWYPTSCSHPRQSRDGKRLFPSWSW
ncbi:HET-domain-containing protein, partial [Glonium stellatum]